MKAQFCAVTLLHFYSCAVTLLHFSVLSLSCTFLFYAGHLNAILVEDVEGNWSSLSQVAELQQLMTQLDVKVGGVDSRHLQLHTNTLALPWVYLPHSLMQVRIQVRMQVRVQVKSSQVNIQVKSQGCSRFKSLLCLMFACDSAGCQQGGCGTGVNIV